MRQYAPTSSEIFAIPETTPGYMTDLKTVELTSSLLTASGKLRKYGGGAGAGINSGALFEVGQSLIGMFLIVNKLKSLRENLSAAAVIHQQTIFALELIRNWPEDEDLGAARSELRKIADGIEFVTDMALRSRS